MEHRTEEGVPLLRLWCTIVTQLNTGIYRVAHKSGPFRFLQRVYYKILLKISVAYLLLQYLKH